MAIEFECPNGHRMKVPDQLAGKRGKCSKCGVMAVVPPIEVMSDAKIFRAQLVQVSNASAGVGAEATIEVGPIAARELKQNDLLLLVRPLGLTAQQLTDIPDYVGLESSSIREEDIPTDSAMSTFHRFQLVRTDSGTAAVPDPK